MRNQWSSLSLAVALGLLATASVVSSRQQEGMERNKIQTPPFTACIDDSDCTGLGTNFACFQYICYPWQDDSRVPEMYRKRTCRGRDDCEHGDICYRHSDRRRVLLGLCMSESVDCSELGDGDCPEKCCNRQFCCEEEYYLQLKSLPCQSHASCRALGYGQWCCPPKNNSTNDYCCDVDPNPPPPTQKPQASLGSNVNTAISNLLPSLGLVLLLSAVLAAFTSS